MSHLLTKRLNSRLDESLLRIHVQLTVPFRRVVADLSDAAFEFFHVYKVLLSQASELCGNLVL